MIVTRKSILSGITRSLDLDITEEQMLKYLEGSKVQELFPHLQEWERELLISGMTKTE